VRTHPSGAGEAIACALAARLAALERATGARVTLIALYDSQAWAGDGNEQRRMTRRLLSCAMQTGIATLDSFDTLSAHRDPHSLYWQWHLNAQGHRAIARMVAARLSAGSGGACITT
jgi:lysophospholipase L1-like esterase